jgi:hypothetical protein
MKSRIGKAAKVGALAGALVIGISGGKASAGGFLGDVIDQVLPGVGTELNRVHRDLGRPVDRAGAAIVDGWVPGLGTAWTVRDEMRRQQEAQGQRFAMGHRCQSRYGISMPGPAAPLGAPCLVDGDPGYIVR